MEKERLDVLLVKGKYSESREKARQLIMAGNVYVNGLKEDKPGMKFTPDVKIEVKGKSCPYVSRGGVKLEKALEVFDINLENKIAIDVGASTGGFTDCMLKKGAAMVIAIDVGYGQFAWELRNDKRVLLMERTNIRNVKPVDIGIIADFAAIDVSFISLKKVIPTIYELIDEHGEVVCLIKPQFEAGRENVEKHGVVKSREVHAEVLNNIIDFARECGFKIKGLTYSPIKGPKGNIEFLLYFVKENSFIKNERDKMVETDEYSAHNIQDIQEKIREVVLEAHNKL